MKLIADCGATSIEWGCIADNGSVKFYSSPGINFSLIGLDSYQDVIKSAVPSELKTLSFQKIWFYAAGCRTESQKETIKDAFKSIFPESEIYVDNDLLAAARALCGDSEGIACILGTGSNACLYSPENGGEIVKSTPPLGYILGDEGSATYIGKRIISDALKGLLSSRLTQKFFEFAGNDKDAILSRIYTEPSANTYIASFSKFARSNLQFPEIHDIIYQSFDSFITRNVLQLMPNKPLPVGFIGSVAHAYHSVLRKVAQDRGFEINSLLQSPVEALVNFHIIS